MTEKEITELKLRVMKRMEQEMLEQLRQDIKEHRHNIFGEIKNSAARKCAQELLSRMPTDSILTDLTERILRSAESRLNDEIKKRLARGVQIRLGDST